MVIQAFVDDSGGKGTTRHFVLAGLIGSSEEWAEFSDEWSACLRQPPTIKCFKMKDAAGCVGEFRRMGEQQRDAKLRKLARIINRYPKITTYSMIDLEGHAQTWGKRPKPQSDPYFWAYQATIMAVCHTLWDAGWRERFEIIYDEDVIFGPRARLWYPVIKRMMEILYPDQSAILPTDPMFKSDDDFLPLQAADMFAWCRRNATDKRDHEVFSWLIEELSNIQETDYSQYYDLQRMQTVLAESARLVQANDVPTEMLEMYRATAALMKRR
ncbi:MAG: DUF3800 domain-containing protein [Rhizomicrobium sp.]|jgi:hypothetical protein